MSTPRSIRRAAERKAAKEARHFENRAAANHANAQFSTGPVTPEGKAISSRNALKTALTGRTVLLPTDDADRYATHLAAYEKSFRPADERECELVQAIADTAWRLDRIPGLEEALYYKGSVDFAADVAELKPEAHATMLRLHTYLAYERHFKNLHLQERRLQNQRQRLTIELKQLQADRRQRVADDLANAARLFIAACKDNKPFDPADYGFEFSRADVIGYLEGERAAILTEKCFATGEFPPAAAA